MREWRNKRGEESLNDSLALISILISREFLFSSPIGTKKKFSREIPREIWNRGNRSNCLSVTSPRSRQTSTLSHLTGLLYFNLRDVLRAQFFFSSLFLSFPRIKEWRERNGMDYGFPLDARIEQCSLNIYPNS